MKYYYDAKELKNIFYSDNEIFNIPFSMESFFNVNESKIYTNINLNLMKLEILPYITHKPGGTFTLYLQSSTSPRITSRSTHGCHRGACRGSTAVPPRGSAGPRRHSVSGSASASLRCAAMRAAIRRGSSMRIRPSMTGGLWSTLQPSSIQKTLKICSNIARRCAIQTVARGLQRRLPADSRN